MAMRRSGVSIERGHTGNPEIDAIWRRIRELADAFSVTPLEGASLITEEDGAVRGSGLVFTSGTTRTIPHRLGRRARGFLEISSNDAPTAAVVGLYATAHPSGRSSSDYVTVTPTDSGTCYLLVF
jgi:hypothetical protein